MGFFFQQGREVTFSQKILDDEINKEAIRNMNKIKVGSL